VKQVILPRDPNSFRLKQAHLSVSFIEESEEEKLLDSEKLARFLVDALLLLGGEEGPRED
jgi:hypothetical protein